MPTSQQITFRGMEPSDSVRSAIERKIAKLDSLCGCVTSCRVVVEEPHRRHQKGKLFHIRIDMTLPGREIVINRSHHEKQECEDVYVAVRDAFDAAREKLEAHVRRRKGLVKRHELPAHGHIARILKEKGYGFIVTPEGREVYFHGNSVLGRGLDKLQPGMEVRYFEERGDKGPQASSVIPAGKHHLVG